MIKWIRKRWSDEQVEHVMGNLLRFGVVLAATVVLAGGAVHLVQYGGDPEPYATYRGEPPELRHVAGIVHGALHLEPRGIMQFGLLLLIATPVARVAFALIAFALQRDLMYVVVSVIVLSILLFSLVNGGV